jgi:catechol 2,3-dioxygenase-like lactoylglutathione lyase family enzyme
MQLGRAIVFAKDMQRMTAFYRDALGLRPLPERAQEDWVVFATGGAELALHRIPEQHAQHIQLTNPPRERAEMPLKLAFFTADLAAARARSIAHGAVMYELQSWGTCDGLDPEGNRFQLALP